MKELFRWTSKRGHPLLQTNSAPHLITKRYHQYPLLHYPWQQTLAGFLPCASTPALAIIVLHLAYVVWAQDNAKIRWSELVTEQPHLQTCPHVERAADSRLHGEELPVEHTTSVLRHPAFRLIEEPAPLALRTNCLLGLFFS